MSDERFEFNPDYEEYNRRIEELKEKDAPNYCYPYTRVTDKYQYIRNITKEIRNVKMPKECIFTFMFQEGIDEDEYKGICAMIDKVYQRSKERTGKEILFQIMHSVPREAFIKLAEEAKRQNILSVY